MTTCKTIAAIVTRLSLPSTQGDDYFCEVDVFVENNINQSSNMHIVVKAPCTFINMDLCGPLATISFGGASYSMLVKDVRVDICYIFSGS